MSMSRLLNSTDAYTPDDPPQECSICMERKGRGIVVGCDHVYCEGCIAEWCMKHEARCPVCRLPVYGLVTGAEDVVYLSPHDTADWGLTVGPQTDVEGRDVFRLTRIDSESISEANGLCADQFVRFFDIDDRPVTLISNVERIAAEAHSKKRLLKVQRMRRRKEEEGTTARRGRGGAALARCAHCIRRLLCVT